jgi:Sensors of blue-light using FAD
MLVRLLYASRAAEPLTVAMTAKIFAQSRKNNTANGITGLLCFTSDIFVQTLEGGRDPVCALFNKIVCDGRHRDVRLLVYEEIAGRHFQNWTMGQVNMCAVNPALLLKYMEQPALDPFRSPGKATMALLLELVAAGAISNPVSTK